MLISSCSEATNAHMSDSGGEQENQNFSEDDGSTGAVSYTHLDVYKRQLCTSLPETSLGIKGD